MAATADKRLASKSKGDYPDYCPATGAAESQADTVQQAPAARDYEIRHIRRDLAKRSITGELRRLLEARLAELEGQREALDG